VIARAQPRSISPARSSVLLDEHGRVMRKLRVSLTDACNYRCFYCMEENPVFTSPSNLLAPEEIETICGELVGMGLEDIRVTGGEPTLRPEFPEIMERLSTLPAQTLALTTNGHHLEKHLSHLKTTRLTKINVSVDSLDEGRFHTITRGGDLPRVLRALFNARDLGFEVKLNAIVFRGINDEEILDFAHFSAKEGVEVRFLEYMKIGPGISDFETRFVPAREMRAKLQEALGPLTSVGMPRDSTARVYTTPQGARLGMIASESEPFCGDCSRLRLSATGMLRPCIMMNTGVSLRGVNSADYPAIVSKVVSWKPEGRLPEIAQGMYQIGG
jgi:cyclic pyranopterin phosphate synthase